MQNFPQVDAEHLRKLRAQLTFHSPGDATWSATVGHLLQMLIDTDLAHHRNASATKVEKRDPVQSDKADWPTVDTSWPDYGPKQRTVDKLDTKEDKTAEPTSSEQKEFPSWPPQAQP